MDINPQVVRAHEFGTVRRGLDPAQVHAFLAEVADELERAQNHATAMEARARAAVQRIQELTTASADRSTAPVAPTAEAETISRTLLLAQRTADSTVAEARQEAERVVAQATEEATGVLDAAREERAQLVEAAREDARREGEGERARLQEEADALEERRDVLRGDVEHLEQFLVAQRERLRDTATTLLDLTERIPGGLGHAAGPLLSSVDAAPGETTDVTGTTGRAGDAAAGGSDTAGPDDEVAGETDTAGPDDEAAGAANDEETGGRSGAEPDDPGAEPATIGEPDPFSEADPFAEAAADTVTWRPSAGETAGPASGEAAGRGTGGTAEDRRVAPDDPTPVGGADDVLGGSDGDGQPRLDLRDER